MCLEYEWEYMQIRAEEARKLAKKIEDDLRKKPVTPAKAGAAAPAEAPAGRPQDTEPVPV